MKYQSVINYLKYVLLNSPAPKSLNYNYNYTIMLLVFIIVLSLISIFILQSTFLILLLMFFISFIPLLNLVPSTWTIKSLTSNLLESILHFFSITGFLKFLYVIYIFWHQCLTYRGFKVFYTGFHLVLLLYLIIVRYIFYLKLNNDYIPKFVYIIYFVCFIFVIFKTLTEASFFFITLICTKFPFYKEILLTELPEELPEFPKSSLNNNNKPKFGGLLNFHFHKHRHVYPPEVPQSKFASYAKMTFALVGLGFTAFAGYNYHRSADAAVRSADIAAVQAQLMSQDEYYRRHPGEKPKI